jgi:hypothetical protein
MTESLCLYTTTISFILLFLYYMAAEPDYVKKEDKRSIRLCTVYALLFSSAIGLAVLTVSSFSSFSKTDQPPKQFMVENPTFNR